MKRFKNYLFLFFSLFANVYVFAQTDGNIQPDQTDFMTADGKIFVVMAVVLVIVIGLFIYLFNLDKKINRLEKNNKL